MNKIYTVRYRLTIRGILTGDDMKVIAPTKHHAIELVKHLINIDCIQTHFDDVHLDCQVIDESEDPLTILLKKKERAMRAIKFRVWYKPLRKMYTINGMTFDAATGDVYGVHFPVVYLAIRNDIELMQYTGIKDREGKEIYEGDIVNNVTYTFNGVVFFDNGSFWVRECLSHVDEGLYDDREKETRWSINLDWKIIGNIYDDPELL